MAQWYDTAYGLQYAEPEDVASWGGGTLVPTYTSAQGEQYQYAPGLLGREDWQAPSATVPSGSYLLELLDKQASGQPLSLADQSKLEEVLRGTQGIPIRDWRAMMDPIGMGSASYQERDRARYPAVYDPDYLPMLMQVHQAAQQGDSQAQRLLPVLRQAQEFATYNATVKQDPFSPLGDPFFGALAFLGPFAGGASAAGALAAGGLSTAGTLGAAGGLAGAAGGLTGMFGEALDMDALRKASIALGAAGGATSLGGLVSGGLNTVGDWLSAAQKAYGVGSKAVGLAQGAGSTPDAPRPVGSSSQALSAADQRTQRSTGSSAGGGSMADTSIGGDILGALGPLLAGAVGLAGSGLSLASIQRYMDQLKTQYGQQEETKTLIDEAYNLAKARYEIYYAETRQEQIQKQEAYQDALEKYETRYGQQQQVYERQQEQFAKIEGQTDQDRATQYESHQANRAKVDESYNRQVQEAAQERDFQLTQYGADRTQVLQSYNQRVAEAQQDRQKQYATYDQQFARHTQAFDRRTAEAAQERGLDLNAYQQKQAIGATLRDPAAIKAGATALYQPLSEAARTNISQQVQAEMASRGVTGGGQYANLMSAKAFAPSEQALWQNALQAYLQGQTGAITAYGQENLTMSPEYQWAQRPEFASSPEYKPMAIPNLTGSPDYRPLNTPQFSRSEMRNVPGAPGYDQRPGVPGITAPKDAPAVPGSNVTYYPKPYDPFGTTPATGGGAGGPVGELSKLIGELTKEGGAGGAIGALLAKLLPGVFGNTSDATNAQNTIDQYRTQYTPQGDMIHSDGSFDYTQDYWNSYNADIYQNLGDIDYSMF